MSHWLIGRNTPMTQDETCQANGMNPLQNRKTIIFDVFTVQYSTVLKIIHSVNKYTYCNCSIGVRTFYRWYILLFSGHYSVYCTTLSLEKTCKNYCPVWHDDVIYLKLFNIFDIQFHDLQFKLRKFSVYSGRSSTCLFYSLYWCWQAIVSTS